MAFIVCLKSNNSNVSTVRRLILGMQLKVDSKAVKSNPKTITFIGVDSCCVLALVSMHMRDVDRTITNTPICTIYGNAERHDNMTDIPLFVVLDIGLVAFEKETNTRLFHFTSPRIQVRVRLYIFLQYFMYE